MGVPRSFCSGRHVGGRGFTLIEMLVVIAILSVLLSVISPSLRAVKEKGRGVVCMSNAGELGMAWSMYATENHDRLCSAMTHFNDRGLSEAYGLAGNTLNNWVADGPGLPFNATANTEAALEAGVLWRYTEIAEVYRCPSDRRRLVRSYALSHTMGCKSSYGGTNCQLLGEVRNPSDKLVVVDAVAGSERHYDGTIHNLGSFDPIDTSRDLWMCGAMLMTSRHRGGCMMCFADMHCGPWKWQDGRTLDFIEGRMTFDEFQSQSLTNADLLNLKPLIRGVSERAVR